MGACSSIESLGTAMQALVNQLGYATFTYGEVPSIQLGGDELPFHITRVRTDFYATYKSENFFRHDPVWVRAMQGPAPFTWADCPEFALLGGRAPKTRARQVVEAAHDFGYTQGVVVPVHGRSKHGEFVSAMISLYWQGALKDFRALSDLPRWFPIVGCFFHDRVLELRGFDSASASPSPLLSPRERDCLSWAAQGKTFSEIGTILEIDARTVEYHVQNAMKKLGVHRLTHAIKVAVQRGLIAS